MASWLVNEISRSYEPPFNIPKKERGLESEVWRMLMGIRFCPERYSSTWSEETAVMTPVRSTPEAETALYLY